MIASKENKFLYILIALLLVVDVVYANNQVFEKFHELKWIGYSPTNFNPAKGIYPSVKSIKKDLRVLKKAGFSGIVTYGSDGIFGDIPRMAHDAGFSGVIMGVWDPNRKEEILNAIAAKEWVDAYCVGNEGYKSRYPSELLKKKMRVIRKRTGKLVTTAERIEEYYRKKDLAKISDFILCNAHPVWSGVYEPAKASKWLEEKVRNLKKSLKRRNIKKLIIVKEAGCPTKGSKYLSAENQRLFFEKLEATDVNFVYFEAFDQPWKQYHAFEPYWGIFDSQRRPKYKSLFK